VRLLGVVPGVAFLIAVSRYVQSDSKHLPFLEYALLQFYVYWGMGTLTYEHAWEHPVSRDSAQAAALGVALVSATAIITYPIGRLVGSHLEKWLMITLPPAQPDGIQILYLPWLAFACLVNAGALQSAVPGSAEFALTVLGGYYPLLAYAGILSVGSRRGGAVLMGSAFALSIAGLATGMMEAAIRPLIVAGGLHMLLKRTVPWRLLVIAATVVLILNPAKHLYRDMAWGNDEGVSFDLRVAQWATALTETWSSGGVVDSRGSTGLASRLNEFTTIAIVMETVPAIIPFDNGTAWWEIPGATIPRVLNPDKVNATALFNNRFNITFGFQQPQDTETSTGWFPLVADGYWNFGWPGVAVVGCILGIILGVYSSVFSNRSWAVLSIGIGVLAEHHAHNFVATELLGILQRVMGIGFVCWVAFLVGRVLKRRHHARG
jgi:hypothetical protein